MRAFRTMTRDLEALRDWLPELGVTQVGMESTDVYGARYVDPLVAAFEQDLTLLTEEVIRDEGLSRGMLKSEDRTWDQLSPPNDVVDGRRR